MFFFGGALTGPYPTLRFGGACGLGVGAFEQANSLVVFSSTVIRWARTTHTFRFFVAVHFVIFPRTWRKLLRAAFRRELAVFSFLRCGCYRWQKLGMAKIGTECDLLRKLLAKSSCLHPPHHGVG